jgi:ferritin
MNEKLRQLLETQIIREMESAYLYLDMSRFYALKGLNGFANWFKKQAHEEMEHAEKISNYLLERDSTFVYSDIKLEKVEYKDVREPLVKQLAHEKLVTSLIHNLYSVAEEVGDVAAKVFLNWFVAEQVEEESNAKALIDKIDLIGLGGVAIYQLDKELANR